MIPQACLKIGGISEEKSEKVQAGDRPTHVIR
jgi:hypothetical protein